MSLAGNLFAANFNISYMKTININQQIVENYYYSKVFFGHSYLKIFFYMKYFPHFFLDNRLKFLKGM